MAQCRQIGRCPTGEAVITTAGRLPAQKVIHTVGPIYRGRPEDARLLASCYRNSLELARRHSLARVAFPSISTGGPTATPWRRRPGWLWPPWPGR